MAHLSQTALCYTFKMKLQGISVAAAESHSPQSCKNIAV